jgi:hypothetical protein
MGKECDVLGKMRYGVENMGKSGLDFIPLVLGIGVGDGLGWLGEEIEECRDSYSMVVRLEGRCDKFLEWEMGELLGDGKLTSFG